MVEVMLELDDSRWSELTHAYGAASDIPALLRALAKAPKQQGANCEPWLTLWSSLYHQGDVYTASYAAIPHVVEIALSQANAIDFSFWLLPASVEVARANGRGPDAPDFLLSAYDAAIARLPECILAHRGESWSQDMTIAAMAALAVSKNHHALAEAIMNLDEDWISRISKDERD